MKLVDAGPLTHLPCRRKTQATSEQQEAPLHLWKLVLYSAVRMIGMLTFLVNRPHRSHYRRHDQRVPPPPPPTNLFHSVLIYLVLETVPHTLLSLFFKTIRQKFTLIQILLHFTDPLWGNSGVMGIQY